MRYKEILLEIDYYDKSSLISLLKKYQDKWIHFSNGLSVSRDKDKTVPHFGINYQAYHGDPKGIYFYPCSWLLTRPARVLNGNQYGLGMKYFYICDVKMPYNEGINLSTFTWSNLEDLAKRNGWWKYYSEFVETHSYKEIRQIAPSYVDIDNPASMLWWFVDYNSSNISRDAAYRGVQWILDPNKSIIHSNEPSQLLVRKTSLITILYSGENKAAKFGKNSEDKSINDWKYFIINFFKSIRGEIGNGEIGWNKKLPYMNFVVNNRKFILNTHEKPGMWGKKTYSIDIAYSYENLSGNQNIFSDLDYAQEHIEHYIEMVTKIVSIISKQKDTFDVGGIFPSSKDIKKYCFDILKTKIFDNQNGETNYEMLDYIDSKYMNFSENISAKIGYKQIHHSCRICLTEFGDKKSYSVKLSSDFETGKFTGFGKNHLAISYVDIVNDINHPIDYSQLSNEYKEKMLLWTQSLRPDSKSAPSKKFNSLYEYLAFLGYIVVHSGLSFDGQIQSVFSREISEYNKIENKEKFARLVENTLRNSQDY